MEQEEREMRGGEVGERGEGGLAPWVQGGIDAPGDRNQRARLSRLRCIWAMPPNIRTTPSCSDARIV